MYVLLGESHWIQGFTRIVLYVTPPSLIQAVKRENINTNTKNLYEIFIRCVFIKELSASTDFLGLVLDGWPYRPYSVFYQGPSGLKRLRLKCKSFGPNQKVSHF